MAKIRDEMLDACRSAARKYGLPLPTLVGVVLQESAGEAFARDSDGMRQPTVRFEGHYFDRRLNGDKRARARKLGLAHPKVGGVKNPSSQAARWDRLINPAMKISKAAALESCSWGGPQIMGAHWKDLGFRSVEAFVDYMRDSVDNQIDAMMKFIVANDLLDELKRGDIRGFVRGYNGSGRVEGYTNEIMKNIRWARSEYGTSTTEAKVVDGVPVTNVKAAKAARGMLRLGVMNDARVREAQALMVRAGITVNVDGDFGPATKRAVTEFQKKHKLEVDGVIGPKTWDALNAYRMHPDEQPGVPGLAEAVTQTPEGRQGASTAITGGGVAVAIQAAQDQLLPLTGSGGWIDGTFAVLTLVAVVATVGGLAYAGYGWLKAHRINKSLAFEPASADEPVLVLDEEDEDAPLDFSEMSEGELEAWLEVQEIEKPRAWGRMKLSTKRARVAELAEGV